MAYNYNQGIYEVQNKAKYLGKKDPRYLSSYELEVFKFCDRHPMVISWGSETCIVKYFNPVKNRQARYLVDLYIKYKDYKGGVHEEIIEIKPYAQTLQPKRGRKSDRTYQTEVLTWAVNSAKWEAASEYARKRKMKFRIMTENSIFRG